MNESNTLKLNGLGVVWNMKGHVLVISKTSFVLVVDKLFPRSDDGLGKCKLNFCICMYNCCFMGVCFNLLNRNRFRMTPLF